MYDACFDIREPDPPVYRFSQPDEKPSVCWRLAKNLRLLRLTRGWSQEALALAAGLDRTYVGALERAERNPTLASMEKLAGALGVAVRELLL